MAVMHDSGTLLPRDKAVERAATPEEQRETLALVRRGLEDGALGIGMGIAYVPLVSRAEILDLFRLAAEKKTARLRSHAQRRSGGTGRDRRAAGSDCRCGSHGRIAARGPHHQHGPARNAAVPGNDRRSAQARA